MPFLDALANAFLDCLAAELAPRIARRFPILQAPPKPGRFTFTVLEAVDMTRFKVRADVPAKTAADVATFELSYTVNGGATEVLTSTGEPIEFLASLNDVLSATFVEIDGAGNRSDPSDPIEFTVLDTVAPGRPGTFGLSVVGQEDEPDEPPVEPTEPAA